tara:strand:+ start:313 stop:1728 length:1416 start_codon:yes stop_codon:yes gene_type:complete
LADRIAAYVLPAQWSAIDVADVEFDNDDKYAEAQEQANDAAESIGVELAESAALLGQHLPRILNSEQGRGPVAAKGLGRSVVDPEATWHAILDAIKREHPKGRAGGFLAGYLEGVASQNPAVAQDLLDEALADATLHPSFIWMQAVVGLDDRGIARIIGAALILSVPIETFQTLGYGRISDDLTSDQLRSILEALVIRDGGLLIAVDIFNMRVFSRRSDGELILEGEREIARWLLERYDFTEKNQRAASQIKGIVSGCLVPGQDDILVERLCERLKMAIESHRISGWNFGKLVRHLIEEFTHSALTVLVDQDEGDGPTRRSVFRYLRDNQPCPLGGVHVAGLLAWANEVPDRRYNRLAQVMRPWTSTNDDEPEQGTRLKWTAGARAVLSNAPDKAKVLNTFIKSFRPTGWSGSYADVIASRISLFDELIGGEDPQLAQIARDERDKFMQDVAAIRKREEEESRERDESFEW